MEVERNGGAGENAPDTPPTTPDSAPAVSPEASAASEAAGVPRSPEPEPAGPETTSETTAAGEPSPVVDATSGGEPASSPEPATAQPEAPAAEAAPAAPAAAPAAPAAREGAPPRPARDTSAVPGRVPEPAAAVADAIPVMSRPVSLGVQLEQARLTPVELEHPKAFYRSILPGVMQVPADYVIAAARKSSLWPMTFGLACCAIEMIATYMAHHDLDRFGIVPWPSPRQCDVMIVAGTVTTKMAPAVKLLYQQMPNPKWVISMGACATNGGPYTRYDRVLQGVDKIIPVDVYVPGCPPRPEALIDGFIALQNKIMEERSRTG
jgi:NADH-quinone oxidoreductase subunit B